MKKTIRLSESELVQLVQTIIKEDEMMGSMDSFASSKSFTINSITTDREIKSKSSYTVRGVKKGASATVDGKPATKGTRVGLNSKITLSKDGFIAFEDIPGFGQLVIEMKGMTPTVRLSGGA
jgi:hypothetical protein